MHACMYVFMYAWLDVLTSTETCRVNDPPQKIHWVLMTWFSHPKILEFRAFQLQRFPEKIQDCWSTFWSGQSLFRLFGYSPNAQFQKSYKVTGPSCKLVKQKLHKFSTSSYFSINFAIVRSKSHDKSTNLHAWWNRHLFVIFQWLFLWFLWGFSMVFLSFLSVFSVDKTVDEGQGFSSRRAGGA